MNPLGDRALRVLTLAVAVDGCLAIPAADTAVDALHWVIPEPEAVLKHIHHDLELAEDQHLHHTASCADYSLDSQQT